MAKVSWYANLLDDQSSQAVADKDDWSGRRGTHRCEKAVMKRCAQVFNILHTLAFRNSRFITVDHDPRHWLAIGL